MDQMDNKQISAAFEQLAQLMELHGQNAFRAKALAAAAYKINKLPFPASSKSGDELSSFPGIGASTAKKIKLLEQTGSLPELEELRAATPDGILQMLQVKGLGPKKILIIWKELGLETLGEVYYACNENRLIDAKGFGLKTQEQIRQAIEFTFASAGWVRYASMEPEAHRAYDALKTQLGPDRLISFTGAFRRKNEVLKEVGILIEATQPEMDQLTAKANIQPPIQLIAADRTGFYQQLFLTSGSEDHLLQMAQLLKGPSTTLQDEIQGLDSEEAIYRHFGLKYIAPELREGLDEIDQARQHTLPILIEEKDLKGTLHNHSTYSDGVHTLEEMALYCRDQLGLEYLGISDHSRTAVYAGGLTIEEVHQQWEEIDRLNRQLAPFHIFKGIESDILSDGSLDYPDEILEGFDFVVASIHSNLKMDLDRATERLIRAIENPYTTMLGHPTGRLLLAREGYPIDHKKVIDACAANQVVIEINANPLRLDLDWRWHRYAVSKGVMLSVNPDAHRTSGLHDMHYGVLVARKGGVEAKDCLNTLTLKEITAYFSEKKQKTNLQQ